jgi:hypothetical protein
MLPGSLNVPVSTLTTHLQVSLLALVPTITVAMLPVTLGTVVLVFLIDFYTVTAASRNGSRTHFLVRATIKATA